MVLRFLSAVFDGFRRFNDVVLCRYRRSVLDEPDPALAGKLRVALVCIAKDEDRYIDEWMRYHRALGVDEIFVYQNNWRYAGNCRDLARFIEFDGEARQMQAYTAFISTHGRDFDFAIFIDVDEFICLVQDADIKTFLTRYRNQSAIALNWRYFGDNGRTTVIDGDYSLLRRFTRCSAVLDRHVKTIVNLARAGTDVSFRDNPHYVRESRASNFTIAVDGKSFVKGPFLYRHDYTLAWINHYFGKTRREFIEHKQPRGKADLPLSSALQEYPMWQFDRFNRNDVENTVARDRYLRAFAAHA